MTCFFEWNPITRKRWQRFRRLRRGWYAFWVLLALYAVSLGSELICNSDPLYVRFEGRSYFPIFRFHPETTFLKNGKLTRPDYKQIRAAPTFAANPANIMLFPIIPYGPNEIIDPDTIARSDAVTLTFRPRPRVGAVDIRADLTIARSHDAAPFFGVDEDSLRGLSVTNTWALPPELRNAMERRFRNEPAPGCSGRLTPVRGAGIELEGTFSEFASRSSPPATVRLTLREVGTSDARKDTVILDGVSGMAVRGRELWERLDPGSRTNLLLLAVRRLSEPVPREALTVGDSAFEVEFRTTDVHWPHAPTRGHWLGIDNAGRDVLARLLYGLRTSMTFGFLLVGLSMAVGTLLGALQGYFGGKVDISGQRFTEIWSALPFLYVMILLGAVYGRSFLLLTVCYAVFNWIGISYYIRAEFLRLRRLPFVEAARAMGLPHRRIIVRHILPNALVPLITFFPFYLVGAIGALAALDYLGFGLPPPTASWGEMLQQAQQFRWAWWLILYPSLALFVVMLLGVFVGEGIRNAYDPRPAVRIE